MKKSGFTLIELWVVVAIIGILSSVAVVAYNGYSKSAKSNADQANLKSITNFLLAEFTRCEMDSSEVILSNYQCDQTNEPDISLITNFFDQNKLFKNPYNTSQSALVRRHSRDAHKDIIYLCCHAPRRSSGPDSNSSADAISSTSGHPGGDWGRSPQIISGGGRV